MNGIQEVVGSIPISSTSTVKGLAVLLPSPSFIYPYLPPFLPSMPFPACAFLIRFCSMPGTSSPLSIGEIWEQHTCFLFPSEIHRRLNALWHEKLGKFLTPQKGGRPKKKNCYGHRIFFFFIFPSVHRFYFFRAFWTFC